MGGERKEEDRRDGTALDSLPSWLRDLIEYSDELAGRDTGRRQRFGVSDDGEGTRDDRGKKKQRRLDELLRLLQNPAYAQLYHQVAETIQNIDDAADRARKKLAREHVVLAEQVEALKSKAAELPDGRKVFRAKNGSLIAEDGTDVTAKLGTIKDLSPETPAWETFVAAQTRLAEIQRQQREIDDYMRDVVRPVGSRLADPDNPLTADELREVQQTLMDTMPSALRVEVESLRKSNDTAVAQPTSNTAADTYVGPSGLNTPELAGQFKAASTVISDDAFAPPAPDAATESKAAQTREPYGSQATRLPATPKI